MLKILLVAVVLLGIGIGLMAIRILLVKNGEFKGTCANNNPFMQKQGVTCGVCGKTAGDACQENEKNKLPLTQS